MKRPPRLQYLPTAATYCTVLSTETAATSAYYYLPVVI